MVSANKRNKTGAFLIVACFLASCTAAGSAPFGGGTGEPNDPYQIATPEQLIAVGKDPNLWDKHFVLTRDLDMKGIEPNAVNPVGDRKRGFIGLFDGQRHTIADLHMEREFGSPLGVFGCIGQVIGEPASRNRVGGHVRNLHLKNVTIQVKDDAGGLAGTLYAGTIRNCSVSGSVTGSGVMGGVGGLVGVAEGQVASCSATTRVCGHISVGGLIGALVGGDITDCSSSGHVQGHEGVGGLIGSVNFECFSLGLHQERPDDAANPGMILRCRSDCSVTGAYAVGGLVAYLAGDGRMQDCHALGPVLGKGMVGGLVGENWCSSIIRCYSAGQVTGGDQTGGLIGKNEMPNDANLARYPPCQLIVEKVQSPALSGGAADQKPRWRVVYRPAIQSCFWDAQASGMTRGLGAGADAQGGLTRLTTAEMRTAATFKNFGWDFEEVWMIQEGKSYPRLRWEQGRPQK